MNEINNIQDIIKELQSNISPQVESGKEQVEDMMNKVSEIPYPTTQTWPEVASLTTLSAQYVARTILNAMNEDVIRENNTIIYTIEDVEDDKTKQPVLNFASVLGVTIDDDDITKFIRLAKIEKNKIRPIDPICYRGYNYPPPPG